MGLPWWPNGYDCVSTAGAGVLSLVWELVTHTARCGKKKKTQDGLFSPILHLICDKFHLPATDFSFQMCAFKL